jgi:hypothetical protein
MGNVYCAGQSRLRLGRFCATEGPFCDTGPVCLQRIHGPYQVVGRAAWEAAGAGYLGMMLGG